MKILQVDGGDGCVEPTRDTIADASYPLSRTLYIYVNKAKITENPAVKAFVDYYLTDAGIVDAVQQTGYVDLPSDQIDATRSTWTSESGRRRLRRDRGNGHVVATRRERDRVPGSAPGPVLGSSTRGVVSPSHERRPRRGSRSRSSSCEEARAAIARSGWSGSSS